MSCSNAFGDNDTKIFGATFENLLVVHSYVIGLVKVDIFSKSKYIQSDIKDNFRLAKEFLEKKIR